LRYDSAEEPVTKSSQKRKARTEVPPSEIETDWGWALRLLGALLLVVAAFIYFDPLSIFQGNSGRSATWIEIILTIVVAVLGPMTTAVVLAVLGVLSLVWGIMLWFRRKSPSNANSE
jgi:type IV secretory pathway VirB2 component (pilin)